MTQKTEPTCTQDLPLSEAGEYLLEECRMVLPGLQALFGFQLIAVFNNGFSEKLGTFEQRLHLAAIVLVALAIAIIMTPAAFHRQTSPRAVTSTFIELSTRLLLWSMAPLAIGVCLDFYVIASMIVQTTLASSLAVILFCFFLVLWFVLPHTRSLQQLVKRLYAPQ